MPRKPRLIDMLPDRRKRRRALVTHDAVMIVWGESYSIAGEAITMDERPKPSGLPVTFDGAVPPRSTKELR